MLKLSSTTRTNMYSYEETGAEGSSVFSSAFESLSWKISSNFKVTGGLHIVSKIFGLAKVLKTFHLYRLDARYLPLAESA